MEVKFFCFPYTKDGEVKLNQEINKWKTLNPNVTIKNIQCNLNQPFTDYNGVILSYLDFAVVIYSNE